MSEHCGTWRIPGRRRGDAFFGEELLIHKGDKPTKGRFSLKRGTTPQRIQSRNVWKILISARSCFSVQVGTWVRVKETKHSGHILLEKPEFRMNGTSFSLLPVSLGLALSFSMC